MSEEINVGCSCVGCLISLIMIAAVAIIGWKFIVYLWQL